MNEPITCITCNEKTLSLVSDRYRADLKHDGRTFHVDIPHLKFYRCDRCGSVVVPDESDKLVGLELRRVASLLMPHQIKAIRKKFGDLSQKQLADQLGIGEATVCRWEKGTQIQQRAFDRMLRAYEDLPELRDYLAGRTVTLVESSIVI